VIDAISYALTTYWSISRVSLTTKINGLQLLNRGILRDLAGLRGTNLSETAGEVLTIGST
jgi:hypothetical protein